ncbi:MAG: spore coat protein CotJB [Halanaerobiales bacterium]|nr:spore coat protein CotJB [Halanaerobiales bacterium]
MNRDYGRMQMPWRNGMMPIVNIPFRGMMPRIQPPCMVYAMRIPDFNEMPDMGTSPHTMAYEGNINNHSAFMKDECGEDYYKKDCGCTHNCKHHDNYLDHLNKKYSKISDEAKSLLKELMAIEFALLDLNLYLNTHPMDQKALDQFNYYVEKARELVKKVEEVYGPITADRGANDEWEWLTQPWPWRIDF